MGIIDRGWTVGEKKFDYRNFLCKNVDSIDWYTLDYIYIYTQLRIILDEIGCL